MAKKSTIIILVLIIIIAILLAVIIYQNRKKLGQTLPPTYGGILFDSQCDQFPTAEQKSACCAELHKNEPTIECIGEWMIKEEDKKCVYECTGLKFKS